jgi:zinc/manganese transport system permease protein
MTLQLLASDVFRNAMIAGTIAGAVASLVGYFIVLRAQAFAAESLLDVSFAGATGAALFGFAPILGAAILALGAALGIGALGERARERDVEIGMVVSFALGLGIFFLTLYARGSAAHSNTGMTILFGSLLSVQGPDILRLCCVSVVVLAGLAAIFRPLLFATVDPEAARARGVPVRILSALFLLLLALAAAAGALVIGVLLATALLIAPAAAAVRLSRRPQATLLLSLCLGVGITWGGILFSFFWPGRQPPVGFSVSALAAAVYFVSVAASRRVYARRGKTIIIGDSAETAQWTSRKGSTRPSRSSEKERPRPGGQ